MRFHCSTVLAFTLAAAVLVPRSAHAQELRNDGYTMADGASFSSAFVAGEIAASRFTAPGPARVTRVRLLFGGNTASATVTLRIWADAAGAAPGAELYSGDFMITGADGFSEADLSFDDVRVSGAFRVGIEVMAGGLPALATDRDGTISAENNFIRLTGLGWAGATSAGFTGDWVLRAVVVPDPDAGVALDASVMDASSTDASSTDAALVVDANAPDAPSTDAAAPVDANVPDASRGCRSNSECALGQYCGPMSACTFDCRAAADCANGATCNSLGQCIAPPASSGCGCRVTPRGDETGVALAGVAALLMVMRRRRRFAARHGRSR